MTARWPLPFVLAFGLTITRAASPTVTIDTAAPSGKVSPLFYGLMTEEINHAYDGGLYAELVRNRAFLDDTATPAHWSIVQADGSAATMALDPKVPLNTSIGTSLRLDDLLRDPADREHPLGIVPLALLRDGERTMTPGGDVVLRAEDQLLLAGRLRDRAALNTTMSEVFTASYVIDGLRVPSSWVWRRFARPDSAGRPR